MPFEDWREVFEGLPESSRELAKVLEAHRIPCFVDDREGPIVTPHGGRSLVSLVLVPPEETERAAALARDWELQNQEDTRELTARLKGVAILSLAPSAGWLLLSVLVRGLLPEPTLGGLAGLWLAAFIVIAQVENRRHRRERIRMPAA